MDPAVTAAIVTASATIVTASVTIITATFETDDISRRLAMVLCKARASLVSEPFPFKTSPSAPMLAKAVAYSSLGYEIRIATLLGRKLLLPYVIGDDRLEFVLDNDQKERRQVFCGNCKSSSRISRSISKESRNQISAPKINEKEVNSPIPVRSSHECELKLIGSNQNERRKDLESVLNPVENLTQWRASKSAKPKPTLLKDQEKENINIGEVLAIAFSEGPHLKSSNRDFKLRFEHPKPEVDDVAVDTSRSSWLVESETTSISKNSTPNDSVGNSPGRVNSSRRYEDRRILGALTVEELR
ncbi:hypothetical protein RHSIM_RhsimUnG0050000 [Rhododendron simsii]|uniref:Uncharacterized protein n=1 Tax=Rhododendron simsii TaxID=118357 RepID=A0A834L2W7_RHOSS|nr:hypothetical protein RHSIM_RhsimUnG0050000 [Rhododendron simsii]